MRFDPESVERFPIREEYDEPWGVRLSDYNKLLELYRDIKSPRQQTTGEQQRAEIQNQKIVARLNDLYRAQGATHTATGDSRKIGGIWRWLVTR